jgi:Uma2 family endonuclease
MMATTTEPAVKAAHEGETRFMLRDIGWSGYETMLALLGDGHVHLTYDRGDLELMSPSKSHERFKKVIARFIEAVTGELVIPCEAAGSTTWRRQDLDRGLEPDECYYITNAEVTIASNGDLSVDPPPDLAIEVEISRGQLDRMRIYAALGISEVWRFGGETLGFHRLSSDGTYTACASSRELPFLTLAEVLHWIQLGYAMGQTPWDRELRAWVHAELAPRLERGSGQ